MAPYRETVEVERLRADAAIGRLELEVGPEHVVLRAGSTTLRAFGRQLVVSHPGRRRGKLRVVALAPGSLFVARGWPGRELALWHEAEPGRVHRLWGTGPRSLLDDGGLEAGRGLDRLAARLGEALAERGLGGGALASELGHGGHRVLLVDRGDRLVLHARPLFREHPRRCLEVCGDGGLVVHDKKGDRRAHCASRFSVVAAGDRVCFTGPDGKDVVQVFLPWIAPEARAELARRFADRVDPAPYEEARYSPAAHPAGGALSARLATAWPLPLSVR